MLACAVCASSLACALDDDTTFATLEASADELCPALPDGIEPILGLSTSQAYTRFGGLVVTLSERELACDEPAVQNDSPGPKHSLGLTVSLPEELAVIGTHDFRHPVHIEFETQTTQNVGGGGELGNAMIELFEITDTCVTGRIIGLEQRGGPFDGGFRAPRCSP